MPFVDRRNFMKGILAAGVAPYVITTPGLLMPVRQIWMPPKFPWLWPEIEAYSEYGYQLSKDERFLIDRELIKGRLVASGLFFDCGGVRVVHG